MESVDDILVSLRGWQNVTTAPTASEVQHPLLDLLRAAPQSCEALAAGSGWSLPEVLVALTELELDGRVACEAGLWMHRAC
ncbi:DprA winged helix domain protein [compost metagenome]